MLEATPIDYQQLQSGLKGLHVMQNLRERYFSLGDSASKYLPLGRKDDYLSRQQGSSLYSNPMTRSSFSSVTSSLDDRLEMGGNYGVVMKNAGVGVSTTYGKNNSYQSQPQLNYQQ